MGTSDVRVGLDRDQSLEAIERAAELWGAEWLRHGYGGRLVLPVQAGLRRGTVTARISADSEPDGTRVAADVESSHYRLQAAPLSILAVGGLGALALILWPLYPRLLALAPLALIFTVVAWLVVASRLQNSGIEEFLELVAGADIEPEGRVAAELDTVRRGKVDPR